MAFERFPRANYIGFVLRDIRKGKNLTLKQVSCQIGVAAPTLGSYERGAIHPTKDVVKKICRAMHVLFSDLPEWYTRENK